MGTGFGLGPSFNLWDGSFYVSAWSDAGCPDIWLTIILGVSVRVCPGEVNFWIGRLRKEDCFLQNGWALMNPRKERIEQEAEEER